MTKWMNGFLVATCGFLGLTVWALQKKGIESKEDAEKANKSLKIILELMGEEGWEYMKEKINKKVNDSINGEESSEEES